MPLLLNRRDVAPHGGPRVGVRAGNEDRLAGEVAVLIPDRLSNRRIHQRERAEALIRKSRVVAGDEAPRAVREDAHLSVGVPGGNDRAAGAGRVDEEILPLVMVPIDGCALGRGAQHRRSAERRVSEDTGRRALLRGADPEEEGVAGDHDAGVTTSRQRQGVEHQPAGSVTDLNLLADAGPDERHPAGDGSRAERLGLHLLPDQVSSRDVERMHAGLLDQLVLRVARLTHGHRAEIAEIAESRRAVDTEPVIGGGADEPPREAAEDDVVLPA